ncbi:MAG: type I-MYXAN CRISPR-associated protein Cas6/Cmx6 [Proteobacteria bacterium]|nr:type I-MYXAN CRISPR-associated protein Cas6/Cmx6 [Pseudomonadota bacterium]
MVDLCFPMVGLSLSVDHGYALYAAVCRAAPRFHGEAGAGLGPVTGRYAGEGLLDIGPGSVLTLRLTGAAVADYLHLAGRTLEVEGHRLAVGPPRVLSLTPAGALAARIVTTRNGHDHDRFVREAARQMEAAGVSGNLEVGRRRTFRVQGLQVVGWEVRITDLSPGHSVRLQETGIGGRRRMGCGFFRPAK